MIAWLGHSSFRIIAARQVYVDPYAVKKGSPAADLILITHEHPHHCSPPDVEKLLQPSTLILCNGAAAGALGPLNGRACVMRPGEKLDADGVPVEALPAYTPGGTAHARAAGGLGYLVRVRDKTVYHAGDTGLLPGMKGLRCDVALLPVSGDGVMTAEEAAEAARLIAPGLAIPMHYGSFAGTITDARTFCARCQENGIAAKLLTPP